MLDPNWSPGLHINTTVAGYFSLLLVYALFNVCLQSVQFYVPFLKFFESIFYHYHCPDHCDDGEVGWYGAAGHS